VGYEDLYVGKDVRTQYETSTKSACATRVCLHSTSLHNNNDNNNNNDNHNDNNKDVQRETTKYRCRVCYIYDPKLFYMIITFIVLMRARVIRYIIIAYFISEPFLPLTPLRLETDRSDPTKKT